MVVSNLVTAAAVGSAYGYELVNRVYIYLLPSLVYFGVKSLHYKLTITILIAILIIGLPLSFIAQYGNQVMDYLTEGYLSGANFFPEKTTNGWIDGTGPIGTMKNAEQYTAKSSYNDLETPTGQLLIIDGQVQIIDSSWNKDHLDYFPHYICISNHDKAYFDYFLNQLELLNELQKSLEATDHCNLTFSNPDMQLYCYQDYAIK
jgi:hypothetical protein